MSGGEVDIDNVQEQFIEDGGQSPQSKQSMSMYGPSQGIPRPGMPQSFRPGMRPLGMPPMGYRVPMMRGPRPLGMRPNHPGMRPMGMPGYRGPPRPFDGPPRPPYEMPLRGPSRYPPQRFSVRMNDNDPNNESAESYFEQESFSEDFQNMPPGMHLRGPPPRGYGMPPGSYMGAPPGPRSMMNGGPSGSEIGPPGYGPPRPGFMPTRNLPPGAPYPPLSPNGQGIPFDGQSGVPPVSGPSQPYGMPPLQNVPSNGDMVQQGRDVDSSSPSGLNQSGGPLLPAGQSDSDERQNILPGQVPPNPMQPHFGMPPYGLPQGAYQQGISPMAGGPPGPYMQMPMGFPPVPPMVHSGPMGMYSMPPPTQHSGPSGGYSNAPPVSGQPHPLSAPPPSNPREEIWIENTAPDGKVYFYNMQTRETRWDRPENVTIIRQGDVDKPSGPPSFHAPAVSQPPNIPIQANPVPLKPPEVAAWAEYKSGDGKSYYHNSQTNQTTWDKPQALIDWENSFKKVEEQPKSSEASSSAGITQASPTTQNKMPESAVPQVQQMAVPEKKTDSVPQQTIVAEKQPESEKEKEPEQKDSSRPISSTAVSGTPWCVVWTGDGRVFFFNPSKRISVWETPDELKGRADVERLLEKPPGQGKDSSEDKKSDTLDQDPPTKKPRVEPIQKQVEIREATPKSEQMVVDDEVRQIVTERIGEDAMKEALDRAAKDQASLPAELRLQQFRQMLIDKQVSAFSTWDKELHKIVFDHRYLLLTCEERKQAFEAYVRERAEVERSEKKHKMREKKDKFNELLSTANLNTKSSYSDFASKYGRDERFKGIEKSRERESLFQAFVSDLRRREKDKSNSKDKLKADFIALLKEHRSISRRSHWSDVKRKIDTDSRYKAVDSSSRREDWFREYVKKLDDVKESEDSEKRKEREKRERQEASLRERKKEVEEARTNSMRERDRERESHLRREAESNLNALLTDIIKSEIMPWKEAKRLLRKNSRWDAIADVLTRSERENLFDAYISGLNRKAKEVFLKMLEGNDSITYWTSWRDVRDTFKDDSRFEKLLSSEKKWKSEFRDWANERESKAKNSFNEMLKEKTSLLSSAKRQSSENNSMLDDVLSTLKVDIRYRAVESSEAKAMLEDFLQSLSD